MRNMILVTIICLFSLPGCIFSPTPVYTTVTTNHPVIPEIRTYPGGLAKEGFWKLQSEYWDNLSKKDKLTEEDALGILTRAHELDAVLKAREAQIKKYNEWATAENAKNGFK